MTEFGDEPPGPRGESVVPMINVVFLLLVFFLMTATLAPPEPFEIAPPTATGEETQEFHNTLYLAADGRLAYGDARGDSVLGAIAVQAEANAGVIVLRADGMIAATEIARLLERLAAQGVERVEIVVETP